jgi:hypothetical protein
LKDIAPTLSKCLQLPPQDMARPGMQVTMRLGFSKSGNVLGTPRFTYITHEAPEGVRTAYRSAATDMLDRCQPLPLSTGLGGAIAGRPFVISIIDDRKDTKEKAHPRNVEGPGDDTDAARPRAAARVAHQGTGARRLL